MIEHTASLFNPATNQAIPAQPVVLPDCLPALANIFRWPAFIASSIFFWYGWGEYFSLRALSFSCLSRRVFMCGRRGSSVTCFFLFYSRKAVRPSKKTITAFPLFSLLLCLSLGLSRNHGLFLNLFLLQLIPPLWS